MKRHCAKCETEYELRTFYFDSGFCCQCKPGFLSAPLWFQPSPAGTRKLWQSVVILHIILLFLFSLLIDGGEISVPGSAYCLTFLLYFGFRFILAKFKGYPILSRLQVIALLLMPLYGLGLFVFIFHLVQRIKYGI